MRGLEKLDLQWFIKLANGFSIKKRGIWSTDREALSCEENY